MSVAEVRSLLLLTDSFYIHDNTAVHYFTLYILYTLISKNISMVKLSTKFQCAISADAQFPSVHNIHGNVCIIRSKSTVHVSIQDVSAVSIAAS